MLGALTPVCGVGAAERPIKIVVLGDSLSAGFGLPVEAAFPSRLAKALKAKDAAVTIANAGVSGDTASAGFDRLDWSVPEGADAVILELGANDALRGLDPKLTKAALDKLVEAWRAEHPLVGFTRVVVGDCAGGEGDAQTQFANDWNHELAAELYPIWSARNYLSGSLIDVEQLVGVVDAVLRGGATLSIPSITVAPRPVAP